MYIYVIVTVFDQIKIVYYRKMFWAKQQLQLKIGLEWICVLANQTKP